MLKQPAHERFKQSYFRYRAPREYAPKTPRPALPEVKKNARKMGQPMITSNICPTCGKLRARHESGWWQRSDLPSGHHHQQFYHFDRRRPDAPSCVPPKILAARRARRFEMYP